MSNTTQSDEQAEQSTDDFPHRILLEASGPAKRHVEFVNGDSTAGGRATMDTDVEVTIAYTSLSELSDLLGKSGRISRCIQNTPKCELHTVVEDHLDTMDCTVSQQTFLDEWDVTLDGPADSWVRFAEYLPRDSPRRHLEDLAPHDVFGKGVNLAVAELDRREDDLDLFE
jgi:hypothetical protein